MPGTALVLIVSYLMAKSTPWEMQRSVEPVSKKKDRIVGGTASHLNQQCLIEEVEMSTRAGVRLA
jgi:hypothetical protein